ncbi:MAG: hypothetical protein P4M09_07015 [Devosia sp.]|nr:hypothetical protein [Devosia sp.]
MKPQGVDATSPRRLPVQGGAPSPLALVLVPGFSGAPWDPRAYGAWRSRILVTARLPDTGSIDACADAVEGWGAGLPDYALVGDTFGSLVALAVARRQPRGLRALVLSDNCLMDGSGRGAQQPMVDWYVARMRSHLDPPMTAEWIERLSPDFCEAATLWRRLTLAGSAAEGSLAGSIAVPTLVISAEDAGPMARQPLEPLISSGATTTRIVLSGTGPLFRFTDPDAYATAVVTFLDRL